MAPVHQCPVSSARSVGVPVQWHQSTSFQKRPFSSTYWVGVPVQALPGGVPLQFGHMVANGLRPASHTALGSEHAGSLFMYKLSLTSSHCVQIVDVSTDARNGSMPRCKEVDCWRYAAALRGAVPSTVPACIPPLLPLSPL